MFENKIDYDILKEINKKFLSDFPYIKIDEFIEGSNVDELGIKLGCRTGPTYEITGATHELCHLVEIDDARTMVSNWGFKIGQIEINGILYYEPQTNQASMREMRVFAYQYNLDKELGLKPDFLYFAKLLDYMADWGTMMKSGEKSDERYARLAGMMEDMAKKEFTVEKFKKELERKKKIIESFFLHS